MDHYNENRLLQTESVYSELKVREEQLRKLLEEKEQQLKKAPEGKLHIIKNGKNHQLVQYYHRKRSEEKTGKYIRKSDKRLAELLAQKVYDQKLVSESQREVKYIQELLKNQSSTFHLIEKFSEEHQKLIAPAIVTDEKFIENWMNEDYEKNYMEESKVFFTKKEEKVRSKSEVIIANMLADYGIPYKYERPIYWQGIKRAVPDFTVLNVKKRKEFIWEHLGMMDDTVYANKAISKLSNYGQMGLFPGKNLILSFETSDLPLNTRDIQVLINEYLL